MKKNKLNIIQCDRRPVSTRVQGFHSRFRELGKKKTRELGKTRGVVSGKKGNRTYSLDLQYMNVEEV